MTVCESTITRAKNLGVDESETILIKKRIITIRITDSQISEIKENSEKSLGVRLVKDKKIITSQTTNIDENIVDKAFRLLKYTKSNPDWKNLPFDVKKKLS